MIALVVATGIAVGLVTRGRGAADSALPTSEVVRVARRDVGTVVKATGVIKPSVGAEVRVGSRVSGVVNRLYVKVGDRVAKGQLLAELDDRDLVARRDEAAADLQRVQAELRYAELDLERKRELERTKVISPDDFDLATRAYAVARQQVAVAEATLRFAATQLDYARIVAPIAGVVASVSTQEGETVAASFAAPTFVTLIDLSRLEVWAYVDETDIGRIEAGQAATFTVDTYPDTQFSGVVTTIYPQAEVRDNVVDYVAVVGFHPAPDRILRPEMTTTVRIALQVHAHVLALPLPAVRWDGGVPWVALWHDGVVERRAVKVGNRDESFIEIVDGLRKGDPVLLGELANPSNHD